MATEENKSRIRPMESYLEMTDGDVLTVSSNVYTNMDGNDKFPNPPVDLKELKINNDNFLALIAESVDRSRRVIAQKNKVRAVIIQDLRLLGRYVEKVANGNMAIFTSSGFIPASNVRVPQAHLSSNFRSLAHGSASGQLVVRLKKVPNAVCYDLRYAEVANSSPGAWTNQLLTRVKMPVTLNGLTPGTTYVFQARSLDKDRGYSDWSDSVSKMCI